MSGIIYPRHLVVLYHAVAPPNTHPILDRDTHILRPEVFLSQLNWLGRFYDFAPLGDVVEAIKQGSKERLVAITFDDGYKCVKDFAVPVLVERQIPATIFLISSVVSNEGFWRDRIRSILSAGHEIRFLQFLRANGHDAPTNVGSLYRWSKSISAGDSRLIAGAAQKYVHVNGFADALDGLYLQPSIIKEMSEAGISFGNHTQGHHVLSTLDRDGQKDEITEGANGSPRGIEFDSDVLSLPFGGESDWNVDTLEIIAELGYSTVLATVTGNPRNNWHCTTSGNILEIQRVLASRNLRGILKSMVQKGQRV
jgi:peptidoglycan/xylan/chitin deacetylase (PgdA/CDA1 family)